MNDVEMMTVKEVARFLQLNEKVVYRLVKEGRLPGTRITGKWLFPKRLIRQWIETHAMKEIAPDTLGPKISSSGDLYISGSDDMILDQCLATFMKEKSPEVMAFFSNIGSINGLKALQMGKCHISTLHLYDPETERYNAPFLERYLPCKRVLLFNLSYRHQGLIIRPESREIVKGIGDLTKSGIKIINREYGSGTRCLLDHILSQKGINPATITGYENEVFTHLEVGLAILRRDADAGLGIKPVASQLGLKFLPLCKERYDLAIPAEYLTLNQVQDFLKILQSDAFRSNIKAVPGYDIKDMGKMIN